jgi:hypothetical protein
MGVAPENLQDSAHSIAPEGIGDSPKKEPI